MTVANHVGSDVVDDTTGTARSQLLGVIASKAATSARYDGSASVGFEFLHFVELLFGMVVV